jgi:hypothetical protein
MSDLTEMWAALERYQPYADKAGHGDSWRRMTTERTVWEVHRAALAAGAAGVPYLAIGAAGAAAEALWAAAVPWRQAEADRFATYAIEFINKAMEVQP